MQVSNQSLETQPWRIIMTRYEAVKNAIAHKKQPVVPYSIYLTGDGTKLYGQKLIDRYASDQIKEDLAAGKLAFDEAYSLAIGNCVLRVGCPWWGWHSYPEDYTAEEAPSALPYTVGNGSYKASFEHYQYIKEHYDVYVLVTIFGSHFEKAYFARGLENFMADLAGAPEFSKALLDMIIRKNMVMLENFLVSPHVDGVLLGSDWGTQRGMLMSPKVWRELIKNGEQQEYDLIHYMKKDVFVHSCGKIDAIIPDLCEMGLDVLNPVQPECMDLDMLQDNFGDKLAYWGGISTQQTLPNGTPEEVREETRRVISIMNRNNGYITSPSQEIMADVPYENLIALIETAKEHFEQ